MMNDCPNHLKNGYLHRLDARSKVIGFLMLIIGFAAVEKVTLLPVILMVSMIIWLSSGVSVSYLVRRFHFPGMFILFMGVLLLFFSKGTPFVELGPITITREGLFAFLLIMVRFVSILGILIIFTATTPIDQTIRALRELRTPDLLVDLVFFTYRYLHEIMNQFQTMQIAMRTRGFRDRKRGLMSHLRSYASLIGTMFIRSYDQSTRVYHAMMLRGYGNRDIRKGMSGKIRGYDVAWMLSTLIVSAALWIIQFLMGDV